MEHPTLQEIIEAYVSISKAKIISEELLIYMKDAAIGKIQAEG